MRNVLVTGASGLIGKAVCEGLLSHNTAVVGTDNSPCDIEDNPNFKFIRADITNKETIERIITENKVDALVHLACTVDNDFPDVLTSEQEKDSAAVDKYLYKFAVAENLKDIIMISTHQVYAPQKTREPIREISPEKPITTYAKIKLDSEKALKAALKKGGTSGVVMRTCPVYTKDFTDNLRSKVYDEKEGCAFVYGYGDYGYSFTCVYNIVDFVVGIINQKNAINYEGIYNVCDSKPILAKEIVDYLREAHKLGAVIEKNYGSENVKSVFGILPGKAAKSEYRYNDISIACSNISYDNTKAQRISSFRWKLSNTK